MDHAAEPHSWCLHVPVSSSAYSEGIAVLLSLSTLLFCFITEKPLAEAQPELGTWGDGKGEDELSPEEIQMVMLTASFQLPDLRPSVSGRLCRCSCPDFILGFKNTNTFYIHLPT